MGKTVKKYRFIDGHRIGETESWLTDMASRGLHLISMGPAFARFERGRPAQMRYRIDFTDPTPESGDEQRALYAEGGWTYVCEQHDMRIYRSPEASGAPELHTDPAEQAYTLKRFKRRYMSYGIITVLLYAAALCMIGLVIGMGGPVILGMVEGDMLNLPLVALLQGFGGYTAAATALSTRKLIRSLREGRAIDHRANWKRLYRARAVSLVALAVIAPVVIGLPFVSIALRHNETLPEISDNQTYIRLAEIEKDPALERRETPEINGVEWLNSITRHWSPFAPIMLRLHEHGVVPGRMWPDGSGEYTPDMECQIYRLRFAWLADGVLDGLYRRHETDYDAAPIHEWTGRQGFDRLYVRESRPWCEIFASKGSIVVRLRYYGEKDVDSVVDAVAELLARG